MAGFFEKLENRARQVNSLLCVGLDPYPTDLPSPDREALKRFCLKLVEATQEVALAYKPNTAFFEAFGAEGMLVLQEVIQSIPPEIPVILDAKRGDIASTAAAIARAAFDTLAAGALTVNPYLGFDSLQPLLQDPEKAIFLLCKTSNPGAGDLQDVILAGGEQLYEHVAHLARRWNERGNIGLVVGATHAESLRQVRQLAPEMWILAPGIGAQGGSLRDTLAAGLRADGLGLLVPVSRAISQAENPSKAAAELVKEINQFRQNLPAWVGAQRESLADDLLEAGCIRFGQFTLKSGMVSPIYLDLRRLISFPRLLAKVASAYLPLLQKLSFSHLAGLPYAAIPIATAISLQGNWSLIYPRKEAKAYGTQVEIEGQFQPGDRVVVIDDLATTGESKFEAIEKLRAAGLQVEDVVVLIDRQSGAKEALAEAGFRLHAVLTLSDMLAGWERSGKVPAEKIAEVRAFLAQTR